MTTNPPVIQLDGFGVEWQNFTLHPIDLTLKGGMRVALVGPNGAGKTTLLRAIAGSLRSYKGRVLVDGTEVRRLPAHARTRVGILRHTLRAYGWWTIAEYLRFLAPLYPTWSWEYCESLQARLSLRPGAQIGLLSKGMQVKLAFLAAEAFRPPILLLDEPTSGLDPVVRRDLMDTVREAVQDDAGRLVIFSTHLLEDVEWLADRAIVMRDGRITASLSLAALRGTSERPSSIATTLFTMLTNDTVLDS